MAKKMARGVPLSMSQIPPRTKTSTNFVEDIIAERMSKKRKEWLVRWKGFSHEDDTWEPLEHLSGCEQYIARSEEERDRKQAEDDDARGPVGDRKGRDAMMTKYITRTCINIGLELTLSP
eukprot:Em0001g655a